MIFLILLIDMSHLSSEEYLKIKLKPIFNALTESIVKECPEDPVSYNFKLDFIYG